MNEAEETPTGAEETKAVETKRGPEQQILIVTDKGFGIRTLLSEFRVSNRGTKGTRAMYCHEKNGNIIAVKPVKDGDIVFLTTAGGQGAIIQVDQVKLKGRGIAGVKLMTVEDNDKVVAVA